MPQDHYVAKTYLNSFVDCNGMLIPYYKRSRKTVGKSKHPTQVCKANDGDTNHYFKDPRALDEYLQRIENRWQSIIKKLENRKISADDKYLISAYIAFLRLCTPTSKRLVIEAAERALGSTVQEMKPIMLQSLEDNSEMDDGIKSKLRNSILSGEIVPEITDEKYPQALALQNIVKLANRFYCSDWEFFYNDEYTPFITSDNPVCLLNFEQEKNAVLYFPLTPKIALAFKPNDQLRDITDDLMDNWEHKNDEYGRPSNHFVDIVNDLVIKSAEKTVLHSSKEAWIEHSVKEHSNWRVETIEVPLEIDGKSGMFIKQVVASII